MLGKEMENVGLGEGGLLARRGVIPGKGYWGY